MITRDTIIEAYLYLRENNSSVPTETLEFMKEASLNNIDNVNGKYYTEEEINNIKEIAWQSGMDQMQLSITGGY